MKNNAKPFVCLLITLSPFFLPGLVLGQTQLFVADMWLSSSGSAGTCSSHTNDVSSNPIIEFDQSPQNSLFLCTCIGGRIDSGSVPVDVIQFDVFKFTDGIQFTDQGITVTPLRSFFIPNPASLDTNVSNRYGPFCREWDGNYNIEGEFGKTNGQFGFVATVSIKQSGSTGNVDLKATAAYPFSTGQQPLTVDVVNVHVVRSSPTVIGGAPAVAARPYTLSYRLSKDSNMTINLFDPNLSLSTPVRTIVPGLPRVGEGIPNGSLSNTDSWDGRDSCGNFLPRGVYLAVSSAASVDAAGLDTSAAVTRQIALDPLQITDVAVSPLTSQATSLALISYVLTEPATTFLDVWSTDTVFEDVNVSSPNVRTGRLLRSIVEQKTSRQLVTTVWDGRDAGGNILPDGNYVFSLYARLPSAAFNSTCTGAPISVTTSKPQIGALPILRGFIGTSQITPSASVIGSNPAIGSLNPFNFAYTLSRDAVVSVKILNSAGTLVVKTLVDRETRPGGIVNVERWQDGLDDEGRFVSSGTYLAQLAAQDPFTPSKIATTTASFPVNLFRVTDVQTTPLLTGATDQVNVSYQLSQGMNVTVAVYPPGTQVLSSSSTWPPCGSASVTTCSNILVPGGGGPVFVLKGFRAGRLKVTDFWDGRDTNGKLVRDGTYIMTLVAESTTTPRFFATDRVIQSVTVSRGQIVFPFFAILPTVPQLFNSSQTLTLPPFEFAYTLTRPSTVTIQILNSAASPQVVRSLISGQVRDAGILNRDFWDARDDGGNFVSPGSYVGRIVADDIDAVLSNPSTVQQTISVSPLRIYDVAVTPLRLDQEAQVSYQISETMKVAIKIYKPGTTFDNAGNPSPPDAVSLVRRIIGVRPGRTLINDVWDGRDTQLTQVTDGSYIFKITASTDLAAIDSVTGDVLSTGATADEIFVAEIPVSRSGTLNATQDFETNTIIYPNPVRGNQAVFKIRVPVQARVTMNLYTLNGDLILIRDFGEQPSDSYVNFTWNKDNQSGRKVAHGVYFAVIREEETLGQKRISQTVKKVLLP